MKKIARTNVDNKNDKIEEVKNLDFLSGISQIIHTSYKFILCRIIYQGSGIASITILGGRNSDYLSASSLVATTQTAVTFTATGVLFVIAIYAKGSIAENRLKEVGVIYRNGFVIASALTVPAFLLTWYMGSILRLAEQPVLATEILDRYNKSYSFSIPANLIFMHYIQLLLVTKDYKAMAAQSIVYAILLTTLSYMSMEKQESSFFSDEKGVGLANVIASWSSVLLITTYLVCSRKYKKFHLLAFKNKSQIATVWELTKKGIPIGFQGSMETIYSAILSIFMGRVSNVSLSASAPVWSITNTISPITFGLAHVSGVLVRHSVGEENFSDARQYGFSSQAITQVIPSLALILVLSIPETIISLFTDVNDPDNKEVVKKAKLFLVISGISLIADTVRNTAAGAVRGYNDTLFSMFVSCTILVTGLFTSYLLGSTDLRGEGILIGRGVAFITGMLMMGTYWYRKSSVIKSKTILKKEQDKTLCTNICSCLNYYFTYCRKNSNERGQLNIDLETKTVYSKNIEAKNIPSSVIKSDSYYISDNTQNNSIKSIELYN